MFAAALYGQSEEALQQAFEGKQVRVRMDMPATHLGVDWNFGKQPPLDMKSYSDRIRRFGISLRNGDSVMITGIKVKKKNIEFQLGGGGYGKLGDSDGTVTASSVPKSDREKKLEKDLDAERDPARRRSIQKELDSVRYYRESKERLEKQKAADLEVVKRAEVRELRLQSGSRFNLWFPEKRLAETIPTPAELMDMLAEWVDFGGLR